jgi:hypothetical protein
MSSKFLVVICEILLQCVLHSVCPVLVQLSIEDEGLNKKSFAQNSNSDQLALSELVPNNLNVLFSGDRDTIVATILSLNTHEEINANKFCHQY